MNDKMYLFSLCVITACSVAITVKFFQSMDDVPNMPSEQALLEALERGAAQAQVVAPTTVSDN